MAVAAFLRLFNLGLGDPLGDESLLAFRALGMMDFDEAEFQTTPLEWFDPAIPKWTKLSFHDHPLGIFVAQNISMRIFGETPWAFRLPTALFGIFSVLLVYLIGKHLFGEKSGLLSAAILALTVNHIFISRVGLQESQLLFFMLLSIYCFLKSKEKDFYFILMGIALGLAVMTKYTGFILVPIFISHLSLFRREVFLKSQLYIGALAALIIFSPSIIYNLKLYQAVGHFDFQFSYIFGQNPEVWKVAPGKAEAGDLMYRIANFIPNLFNSSSWVFISLFILAFVFVLINLVKTDNKFQHKEQNSGFREHRLRRSRKPLFCSENIIFLILALIFIFILISFVGPATRFLTMFTPFMALIFGGAISMLGETRFSRKEMLMMIPVILFLGFELFYSLNSQVIKYPMGKKFWTYSNLRYENYGWGYNELSDFFKKELSSKIPAVSFTPKYRFIEKIQERFLGAPKLAGHAPYYGLIIFDDNIDNIGKLWTLDRLQIYHSWPVIKADSYFALPNKEVFENKYFVIPKDKTPLKKKGLTLSGRMLEDELKTKGIQPIVIRNSKSDEAFYIYHF